MAQYESWFKQDLKKPIKVQLLNGNLFSQDNQGNLIGVEVFDNGEPASLAGTVSANIIRADGGTVAATGTLSGNKCSVVLPAAAYAIPGLATIAIKLTSSGVVTTLLALVVTIYRASTDTAVDPGTVMPSIQTLIQQINTAVASIPADYSSLWTSLAPAFSTDTSYAAGQYVTNNGKVYRFNAAHSGEWAAGDVSEVKVGNELTDLKSAIGNSGLFYTPSMINGSIDSNGVITTGGTKWITDNYDETKNVTKLYNNSNGTAYVSYYNLVNNVYVHTLYVSCEARSNIAIDSEIGSYYRIYNNNSVSGKNMLLEIGADYLKGEIDYISDTVTEIAGKSIDTFKTGNISTSGNVGETASLKRDNLSAVSSAIVKCSQGDVFILTGTPRNNKASRHYMFTDLALTIKAKAEGTQGEAVSGQQVVAPSDGYIIIQFLNSDPYNAYKGINHVEDHESRIGALEEKIYEKYAEDEDAFAENVRKDIDSNTLVVAIVADTHYTTEQNYGILQPEYAIEFTKIADRVGADFMINLGDMIDSDFDDLEHAGDSDPAGNADVTINTNRIGYMMEHYRGQAPMLYCMSHHERKPYISVDPDTKITNYKLDRKVVHGLCNRSQKYLEEIHRNDDPASSSYYVDFADRKVRVIVLDSTSYTQTGVTPNDCIFLRESVSNLPSEYKCVIFTHCPIKWGTDNNLGFWNSRIKPYLLADENQGKILAYFNGHVHVDNIITPSMMVAADETDTYDFPMIWFDAQKMDESDTIYTPTAHNNSLGSPYRNIRHFGDVTEYLFDVACIHVDTGIINLHRFGAGQYKIRTYNATTGNAEFTPWT